ncbi:MAG: LysR family transcriptional regulator [Pseudomonadota bacterium]
MNDHLTWTGSLSAVDMGQLRCFVMAVDCRSLSAAAKALDISQPAISKKLQKLEHALAVPLLERTPRGVQPTVYGSAYYTHARAVLDELDRGGVDLLRLKGQAPSELRIGATPSFMELILPHAIARFSAAWPSVHFRVRHGDHESLSRQLERRQVDCLLTDVSTRLAIDDVESMPIAQSAQRGYVRRDHPLAKVEAVTFEAMQSSRWILQDLPLYRDSFEKMFEAVALPPPQPTVLSQSLRFLLAMTQRADLVAFMPEHLAQPAVKAGRLVQLNLPIDPWVDDIVVYYRRQFADSLAMGSLIEHCQRVCNEHLGKSVAS